MSKPKNTQASPMTHERRWMPREDPRPETEEARTRKETPKPGETSNARTA